MSLAEYTAVFILQTDERSYIYVNVLKIQLFEVVCLCTTQLLCEIQILLYPPK